MFLSYCLAYVQVSLSCVGHRVALTRAGVLHRDISVGNVLIVDNPDDPDTFAGFLHDFDYSSMSRDVPDESYATLTGVALAEKLIAEADAGTLKERTVRVHCLIYRTHQ